MAERLGHTLAKGHTRTDWTRRPLSAEQLQYAEDDVRYLVPLYLDLRDALEARGSTRLAVRRDPRAGASRPASHRARCRVARLKGLIACSREQRATAKLLAQWREATAIKHDKPRGWILADDALREIAERTARDDRDLETIRNLPPGVVRRRGDELLALIERGRERCANEAAASTSAAPAAAAAGAGDEADELSRARRRSTRRSAPELLATRRDVEQLVFARRTEHLLSGWRREVIGEPLLAGRTSSRGWRSVAEALAARRYRFARALRALALRRLLRGALARPCSSRLRFARLRAVLPSWRRRGRSFASRACVAAVSLLRAPAHAWRLRAPCAS